MSDGSVTKASLEMQVFHAISRACWAQGVQAIHIILYRQRPKAHGFKLRYL